MKPKYPSDEAYRFLLRMPGDLRERLEASAKSRGRSMNAEAIARIEASFKMESEAHEGIQTSEELRAFVDAQIDEMKREHMQQRVLFEKMMKEAQAVISAGVKPS